MCAPSPPPTPDYTQAAQQQGTENRLTAQAQGAINNPNVYSPYGTQTVQWTKAPQGSGLNYSPIPTLKQTLSPEQQAIYNQSTANQQKLGALAGQGVDALKGVVGTQVDFSGAPTTGSYEDTRKSVIDAMMGRANEDYAKQTDNSNSNLIAAGIRPGSTAYGNAQQMIERSHNDARQQAEIAGGNAAAQAYNTDAARRQQAITEQLAQRQTPINEISALMSGSQVSNPFSTPTYAQNTQVQAAPLYGAAQDTGAWQQGMYNVGAAQAANLQSGLFGLGGSALQGFAAKSDRRLKSNIVRVGTHSLGIGVYDYDLDGRRQRGVMAQEVLTVRPSAVLHHPDGYLMVDYARLI